LKIYAFKP